MNIALDIAIPVIFGLTLFIVIKRGFIKSVMHIASLVAAIILAKLFTPGLAGMFYSGLYDKLAPKMTQAVANFLANNNGSAEEGTSKLSKLLGDFDISIDRATLTGAFSSEAEKIASMLVSVIATALAFIVIFLVTLIAFKLLTILLEAVFELPVLKTVNKALGVVLGIVIGLLYVLLFIALMKLIVPFCASYYPDFLNEKIINDTHVFKYLYKMDWLGIFIN